MLLSLDTSYGNLNLEVTTITYREAELPLMLGSQYLIAELISSRPGSPYPQQEDWDLGMEGAAGLLSILGLSY